MESFKEFNLAPQFLVTATVPTVDFSILHLPVKNEEPLNGILNVLVKRENCPSPISRREVPISVKSEQSTPVASPLNPNSVKSEDTSCSALTNELESFQDLTKWCHRAPKTPNMSFSTETDELNTPVPELGDFWFASPTPIDNINDDYGLLNVLSQSGSPELYNGADIQSNNKLNDLESQIFGKDSTDNFNLKSETCQYSNVLIGGGEVQENIKSKNVTFTNNYNNNNVYTNTVNSSLNQQTSVSYQKPNTNIPNSSTGEMTEIISFAPSSSSYGFLTDTAIDLQEFVSFPLGKVVPQTSTEKKIPPRLDFTNMWVENKQIISTPEVINTALSLETGFNLVDFITEGNVEAEVVSPSSIVVQEEDNRSRCPSTSFDPDPNYTPSESSEDEDEEYEPPWKKLKTPSRLPTKQRKQKQKTPVQRIDLDSEVSNASTVESVKVVRRGRPPKRNVSISSESNADPELSRYRELRDKNNEASRRSRLNRKKKEIELEEEAKDLDVRNRKLKVRVQELERLVTTMRTNLMQMLLKK